MLTYKNTYFHRCKTRRKRFLGHQNVKIRRKLISRKLGWNIRVFFFYNILNIVKLKVLIKSITLKYGVYGIKYELVICLVILYFFKIFKMDTPFISIHRCIQRNHWEKHLAHFSFDAVLKRSHCLLGVHETFSPKIYLLFSEINKIHKVRDRGYTVDDSIIPRLLSPNSQSFA